MKKIIIIFSLLIFCELKVFASSSGHEPISHIVKSGETLGEILVGYQLKPLWGKDGWVEKTIFLNPLLLPSKGNLIEVGQSILIPIISTSNPPRTKKKILPEEISEERSPARASFHDFRFRSSARFSTMNLKNTEKANSSDSILSSQLSPGFSFNFETSLSSKQKVNFFLDLDRVRFESVPNKSITNLSQSYANLGGSYSYSFTDNLSTNLRFSQSQQPLIETISQNNLIIRRPWVKQLALGFGYDFIKTDKLVFSVEGWGKYLFESMSQADSLRSGWGAEAGLGFVRNLNQYHAINFWLSTNYNAQDSQLTYRKYEVTSLSLGYVLRLD